MNVYHIDRALTLSEGQILNLKPTSEFSNTYQHKYIKDLFGDQGVGYLGEIYTNYLVEDNSNIITNIRETTLEYVRRIWYPSMPSRFQSFFSVKTLEDVKLWINKLECTNKPYKVWEVEVSSILVLDAYWRDILHTFPAINEETQEREVISVYDTAFTHRSAMEYWHRGSESSTTESRLECLSPFPVRVLRDIVV